MKKPKITYQKNIIIFLLIILSLNLYSQKQSLKRIYRELNGKTIQEGCKYLDIDTNNYSFINEPFGVLRGIKGVKDSLEFKIYVERTSNMPVLTFDTTIVKKEVKPYDLIKGKKVIGCSLRYEDKTFSKGERVYYYDFDYIGELYKNNNSTRIDTINNFNIGLYRCTVIEYSDTLGYDNVIVKKMLYLGGVKQKKINFGIGKKVIEYYLNDKLRIKKKYKQKVGYLSTFAATEIEVWRVFWKKKGKWRYWDEKGLLIKKEKY
jgi:hypothetical protein